jgi:N-methylhydantoinase A
MRPDETVTGPAIVESSFTTIVVDPGATARRTAGGGLTVSV